VEGVSGINRLSRARADARALRRRTRGPWGIEHGRHGVRDGTFREDARRIPKGSGPPGMAALPYIAVVRCERSGFTSAAAATRHDGCHPNRVLEAVSIPIRG
jgi:hypothetical protein